MADKSDAVRYAEQHAGTTKLLPSGKLQFTHSGMEFPPHVDWNTLQSYATGRAYRRGVARKKNDAYDFEQHVPYIVPHKQRDEKHFLYCTLTNKTLPRQRDVLLNHTNGKRYKRRLEEAQQKQKQKQERMEKRNKKRQRKQEEDADADADADAMQTERAQGAQDVLDGLLSSDEESTSGDDQMEDEADADAEAEAEAEAEAHERDEGSEGNAANSNDVDEVMQDHNDGEKTRVKASPNGVQRTLSGTLPAASERTTPQSVKARQFASIKRRRPRTPGPKRVRQARQKRKTEHAPAMENGT